MSEQAAPTTALGAAEEAFGQNAWIVEEMHQQFLTNPTSVDESWRAYFSENGNGHANGNGVKAAPPAVALPAATNGQQAALSAAEPSPLVAPPAPALAAEAAPVAVAEPAPVAAAEAAARPAAAPAPPVVAPPAAAAPEPVAEAAEEPVALRGAAGRIVENMVTSLGVPTATSVHPLPGEAARGEPAAHQRAPGPGRRRRKISFTHLIAYALVKALGDVPALNSSFVADIDGKNTPGCHSSRARQPGSRHRPRATRRRSDARRAGGPLGRDARLHRFRGRL